MTEPHSNHSGEPSASVIIPVFRQDPRFLGRALGSLIEQTWNDFEIIIIEDPSDVPAGPTISQFPDHRIRHYVNRARTSLPQQHNLGMQKARGSYLGRLDSDDIWMPEKLAKQVRFLQDRPNVDVVGTNLLVIDDDDEVVGERRYPEDHSSIMSMFPRANPIANPAALFRRELFEQFGGWDEKSSDPAQDYEWFSRVARGGAVFANIQAPLVRYRLHSASIKRRQLRGTLRTTIQVKKRYWKDRLSLLDAVILIAEHLLLLVPSTLVYRLFVSLRYRSPSLASRTDRPS